MNGFCSCCGCCGHALRTVNELSVPGLISKPHFLPVKTDGLCTACGKCVKACPMGAWSQVGPHVHFDRARGIGCGLCVVACKPGALALTPYEDADVPEKGYLELFWKMAPGCFHSAVRVLASRMFR